MANYASDGNLLVDKVLALEVGRILADRNFIPNHPAFMAGFLGNLTGSGSDTAERSLTDEGTGVLPAVAEGANAVLVDFAFDSLSATIGRRSGGRKIGAMFKALDASGHIKDPTLLARDALGKFQNTMMDMTVSASATFTNDVLPSAGSGNPLVWSQFREAKTTLVGEENEVGGGAAMAIIHPQQWAHLENDYANAGTTAGQAQTQSYEAYMALNAGGNGYKGRYWGIDIFTSSKVGKANSDADYRGSMFAANGIAWAFATAEAEAAVSRQYLIGDGRVHIAVEHDGAGFASMAWYNILLGVTRGIDEAGVTLTSGV